MADQRPLIARIADFPLVALLIAVLLFVFATALGLYLDTFVPKVGEPMTTAAQMAINVFLVLVVYKCAIARLGERPRDDLPPRGAFRNLGLGLLAGTFLYAAVVAVAAGLGVYRIVGSGDASTLIRQLISEGVMAGFMEELLFRGIIFRWIEEFAGSWIALVTSCLLFGLAHILNPNATASVSAEIALEALPLAGAYMLTRNLWMPIGLHAAWNVAQGPIFGVAVSGSAAHGLVKSELMGPTILSGGGFGLEGSIIAVCIAGGAGLWMVVAVARRGEILQPSWTKH